MKSILAIVVTGIVAVGVWALPKEKQMQRLPEVQVVAGGSSNSKELKCPAVSQEATVSYFDTLGDTAKPYIHCKVCNTGVLSEHKDNVVRCTYCGITAEDAANKPAPSATVKEASLQGE